MPLPPRHRDRSARYFTPEPILDPHAARIEAEAERLFGLAFPLRPWTRTPQEVREGFYRIAADSLARDREN